MHSLPDLSGRVVLITGGSRGIGYATAGLALEAGARVVIGARAPERLTAAARALGGRGEVAAHTVDVTDYGQVADFLEAGQRQFSRVDALVNDAGVAWAGPFAEMPVAEIDSQVDVNLRGVLYGCRAALPHLLEQGGGTIVNVSSGAGRTGIPGISAYSATKFAVNGLTEALAGEAAESGVGIYAICPGRVATDMQEIVSGKRQGMSPEAVGRAVLACLGPRPPVRSGQCLDVTG